ncbi:MAG: RNA-binding protein [Planctomycetota bacterium]
MISIYVGNLPYDTTSEQLVELFGEYGEVHRASLVNDRETNRPRGFGFVEMPNRDEADKAIEALAGKDFNGRPMTVNEARKSNNNRNAGNTSRSVSQPSPPTDEHHGEYEGHGADDGESDGEGGYSNRLGKG